MPSSLKPSISSNKHQPVKSSFNECCLIEVSSLWELLNWVAQNGKMNFLWNNFAQVLLCVWGQSFTPCTSSGRKSHILKTNWPLISSIIQDSAWTLINWIYRACHFPGVHSFLFQQGQQCFYLSFESLLLSVPTILFFFCKQTFHAVELVKYCCHGNSLKQVHSWQLVKWLLIFVAN